MTEQAEDSVPESAQVVVCNGNQKNPAHVQVFRVETGLVGLETFRGKHFETSFAKYIRDSRALFLSFLSFFLSFVAFILFLFVLFLLSQRC